MLTKIVLLSYIFLIKYVNIASLLDPPASVNAFKNKESRSF